MQSMLAIHVNARGCHDHCIHPNRCLPGDGATAVRFNLAEFAPPARHPAQAAAKLYEGLKLNRTAVGRGPFCAAGIGGGESRSLVIFPTGQFNSRFRRSPIVIPGLVPGTQGATNSSRYVWLSWVLPTRGRMTGNPVAPAILESNCPPSLSPPGDDRFLISRLS